MKVPNLGWQINGYSSPFIWKDCSFAIGGRVTGKCAACPNGARGVGKRGCGGERTVVGANGGASFGVPVCHGASLLTGRSDGVRGHGAVWEEENVVGKYPPPQLQQ